MSHRSLEGLRLMAGDVGAREAIEAVDGLQHHRQLSAAIR